MSGGSLNYLYNKTTMGEIVEWYYSADSDGKYIDEVVEKYRKMEV